MLATSARFVLIGKRIHADRVKMPAGERAKVERLPVRADRNSIRADRKLCRRLPRQSDLQNFTFNNRNKARVRFSRRMIVQPPPALTGCKVHHDDSVRPVGSRVRQKCHALRTAPQIESHIIEVTGGEGNVGRKSNLFDDPIGLEINRNQLRTTWVGGPNPMLPVSTIQSRFPVGSTTTLCTETSFAY